MGRIFIVDDSRTARKVLKSVLEENGHEVIGEAGNGEEALRLIPEEAVDLITMDITMPIMDGIETLKKLVERGTKAKVVMVSASAQRDKILEALKSGACEFLQKPFEFHQVVDTVNKLVKE
ncbi:MAG: response regulator [Acetivibrio sp.]